MEESPSALSSAAAVRPLRLLAIASYAPSFALCIAHGVLSRQPVPAVGLVPQTLSAVSALLLLRAAASASAEDSPDADADADAESASDVAHNSDSLRARLTHPIAIFALDIVLAAALMVVLVFTWIDLNDSPALSMLAAYATMPILASFFAHVLSALHALYEGFAIHGVVQWLAWRAVPPDCPNCNHRLRPAALPELPWFNNFSWRRSYAPVFVAEDDIERYCDDPEVGDEPAVQPEAVEVRSKRNRKNKDKDTDDSDTDLPWGSSARVY